MSDTRLPGIRLSSTTIAAITLVIGLFAQTAGIVWWGAHIDQRMTAVEQKVAGYADASTLIARLDERTASLLALVNRIDARQTAQDDARLARSQ